MDLNKIYSDLDNIAKAIEQVKGALGAANVTTQRTAEAPAPTRNRSLEEVKNVCNRWINEKHLAKGEDIQIIYNVINEYSSRKEPVAKLTNVPVENFDALYMAVLDMLTV